MERIWVLINKYNFIALKKKKCTLTIFGSHHILEDVHEGMLKCSKQTSESFHYAPPPHPKGGGSTGKTEELEYEDRFKWY